MYFCMYICTCLLHPAISFQSSLPYNAGSGGWSIIGSPLYNQYITVLINTPHHFFTTYIRSDYKLKIISCNINYMYIMVVLFIICKIKIDKGLMHSFTSQFWVKTAESNSKCLHSTHRILVVQSEHIIWDTSKLDNNVALCHKIGRKCSL